MRVWACEECGSLAAVRGGVRAVMPRCPDPGCAGPMYVVDQTAFERVLGRATGRVSRVLIRRMFNELRR